MSQYNLQPTNSMVQQLTQPTQLGQMQSLPPLPGVSYEPSGLELRQPVDMDQVIDNLKTKVQDNAPVQLGDTAVTQTPTRIDIPETQLGQINPDVTSQPALTPLVSPTPDLNQQLAAAYQKMASYQPYGQKHPYLMQLGNFMNQRSGLPALYNDAGLSAKDQMNLAALQRQVSALAAVKQMEQAASTNKTNIGIYNALAPQAGLPTVDNSAVIGDKQLSDIQALVQKYGAPALIAARDKFNQDTINYNRALQAKATYDARKSAGLLQPIGKDEHGKPIYPESPIVPEAPVFDAEKINPYLDAGSAAGLTGTSGEAAKTGAASGEAASGDAAKEKEANARLAELQNTLDFQKQSHQDSIAQQEATRQQGEQHFQSELGQRQSEHQDTIQARRENLAYKEWEDSQKNLDTIGKQIDDTDKAFEQLSTKYKGNAGRIRKDPAYTVIERKRQLLEQQRDQALAVSNQKLVKYRELTGEGQQPAPAPVVHTPQAAPTGQTLHQATPKLKGSTKTLSALGKIGIH